MRAKHITQSLSEILEYMATKAAKRLPSAAARVSSSPGVKERDKENQVAYHPIQQSKCLPHDSMPPSVICGSLWTHSTATQRTLELRAGAGRPLVSSKQLLDCWNPLPRLILVSPSAAGADFTKLRRTKGAATAHTSKIKQASVRSDLCPIEHVLVDGRPVARRAFPGLGPVAGASAEERPHRPALPPGSCACVITFLSVGHGEDASSVLVGEEFGR
jgi:hypothetical protein